MACLKLLRDFLSGEDANGEWTYIGPSPITVTITGAGSTTLNPNDTIPDDDDGDNPELDFETLTGLPCGSTFSLFRYTVTSGGCSDTEDVSVQIECDPDAGSGLTINLCESDDPINLFDQLGGTPDSTGVWSGTGIANGGYDDNSTGADPTDDTFDPGASGVVSLTFTYTVSSASTDCPCPDAVADIEVNVTAAPDAGTGGTVEICI